MSTTASPIFGSSKKTTPYISLRHRKINTTTEAAYIIKIITSTSTPPMMYLNNTRAFKRVRISTECIARRLTIDACKRWLSFTSNITTHIPNKRLSNASNAIDGDATVRTNAAAIERIPITNINTSNVNSGTRFPMGSHTTVSNHRYIESNATDATLNINARTRNPIDSNAGKKPIVNQYAIGSNTTAAYEMNRIEKNRWRNLRKDDSDYY